ncbi:4-hydroxybenzoate octaprenyltransferase [Camelimonas fluminis]|uniref:4-hydroxybenzoate octaprenyltransferase n=1 Tax=Camelimonas fluminis TaxID=1576911 RepID=A0ABV7UDE2_9HYPH|nr:4-hydroxybenzoate octaprenyltransferase [Camelimonas fluminis]GHE47172.1 4-hydroxybenzoate octaprenyltransferase [Camelimonas fluminis]
MNDAIDRQAADPLTLPDADRGNWVDRRAPASARPFLKMARVDRPIGWWLLLLPCWWSATLAAIAAGHPWPNLAHMALFFVGAVAMRGAGSTWNDITDRNLDGKVARTRMRPLPSGQITVRQALASMALQCLIGLAVLLCFNGFTIWLGISSLAIVAVYPFMKRITHMPQFVLGLAFSWGALVGWAAASGSLAWPPVVMYAAAVLWTIGYDTIYAIQDLEDDEIAGIKSSARLFGAHVRTAVGVLYAAVVVLLALALWGVGVGLAGWLGLAGFAAHLAWQTRSISRDEPARSLRLFRSNRDAGLILLAGLLADALTAMA